MSAMLKHYLSAQLSCTLKFFTAVMKPFSVR